MTDNLLLELAHPIRMRILRAIIMEPKSIESVAHDVGASVEEAKMNIERLCDYRFVERGTDARYRTGPLGQLALSLLADLDFVAKHSEYFQEHELTLLPPDLISRLGELAESERTEGSVTNIQRAEHMIRRSKIRIWVVANEVMMDVVPVIREKVSKGTDFRIVIDNTFKHPDSFEPALPERWRQVSKIPAAIVLTGDEAMLFFPDRRLDLDTSEAFASDDPDFMKWCEDLIERLWNEGHRLE